jgi:hypothetical protein
MCIKILIISAVLFLSCTNMKPPIEVSSIKEPEFISMEEWDVYYPKKKESPSKYKPRVRDPNQILEDEIKGIRIPHFKVNGTLIDAVATLTEAIKQKKYGSSRIAVKTSAFAPTHFPA